MYVLNQVHFIDAPSIPVLGLYVELSNYYGNSVVRTCNAISKYRPACSFGDVTRKGTCPPFESM